MEKPVKHISFSDVVKGWTLQRFMSHFKNAYPGVDLYAEAVKLGIVDAQKRREKATARIHRQVGNYKKKG